MIWYLKGTNKKQNEYDVKYSRFLNFSFSAFMRFFVASFRFFRSLVFHIFFLLATSPFQQQ